MVMIDAFVILTPFLLLAVVLLFGFVGCGAFAGEDTSAPPSLLLTVSPTSIAAGASSVLTWAITAGVQTASIDQGIGQVYDATNPSAPFTGTVIVQPPTNTTYTISGLDTSGMAITPVTATVTVTGAPPPPASKIVTHLQTASKNAPAGTTLSVSLPAFPGAGKLIVVTVEWGGAATVTVSAPGVAFNQIESDNLSPQQVATFYATNVSAAITTTATLSAASTTAFNLLASAYDNVAPGSIPDRQGAAQGTGTALALSSFSTTGLTAGDLIYAIAVARTMGSALSGSLSPGASPAFVAESGQGSYILVEDYALAAADVGAPQVNVSATNTSGTATSRWYIFAMRIKHA
jgi:hypothetical protein